MNKAQNITKKRVENISNYFGGDQHLINIANDEFQCSTLCKAHLILCSYRADNIPAPYFKTAKNEHHIENCENVNESLAIELSNVNKKTSGLSAFNKILKKYESNNKNNNFTFLRKENNSYREVYSGNRNTLNAKAGKKIKHVVVECDQDTQIEENITYIKDLNNSIKIPENKHNSNSHWININTPDFENGIGIEISQIGKEIIKKNPTSSIVFICMSITKSVKSDGTFRKYSSSKNRKLFYLVNKKLVYKE